MLIRDPVHGDVRLSRLETEVLDAPEMQRLRGIKQLGTAYLAYPGCTHTRFEHSLGAAHVVHRLCDSLRRNGETVSPEAEEQLGAATLLHDVTHAPFGHTLEDERCLFPRHDKGARLARLLAGALGEHLDRLGCLESVRAILGDGASSAPPWMRQLVSSTIDADLLDYLRRDSYYAGLAQGYDDRILGSFAVEDGQLVIEMTKHGMERPDTRSETVQLLRMRYFLTERIYYHHTKVAAGAMISKAVELAQEHGQISEDEIAGLTDAGLFHRLAGVPRRESPDRRVVRLLERLERRRLLKRSYVLSTLTVQPADRARLVGELHADRRRRKELEDAIAAAAGAEAEEVIVYCPALTVMKEAAALVHLPSGLRRLNEAESYGLSEIQAIEERYAQLWRFYVFTAPEHAARTAAAARDIIGFPSELTSSSRA